MVQTRADFQTARKKQDTVYSDFLADFTPNPNTSDLALAINEASLKRSIRNILLTSRSERLFNPDYGSDLKKLLFEPMNEVTTDLIKTYIIDSVENHEPRAKIAQVNVYPDENNNSYRIDVVFIILNRPDPVGLTLTLFRAR